MAKPSDNPCPSEDDEYSVVLEVPASAWASILGKFVLFEYKHVVVVIESQYRESDFYDLGWERVSHNIDESVWYNYVFNIYAKWNLLNLYLSC